MDSFFSFLKALLEASPNVIAFFKETATGWFRHPHFRNRIMRTFGRYSLIVLLIGALWYTVTLNLELAENNGVLNERLTVLLNEKLNLEQTCAREAPRQQEYAALERRLQTAHETIRNQKEMLDLCTTNQADSVNRRLRDIGRK